MGFPSKSTGGGCHSRPQGIFPTPGSNPGVLHWQVDSLLSEPPGKPEIITAVTHSSRALSECWGECVHTAIWSPSPRVCPVAQTVKNLPANAGDTGDSSLISGEGDGNPL